MVPLFKVDQCFSKIVVKKLLKILLSCYANIIVAYYLMLQKLVGFESVAFRISLLPYRSGNNIRFKFYKRTLASVGSNVVFSLGTVVTNPKTSIGNSVRFGPFNTIGWAKIGNNITIAQHVHILSGAKQHGFSRRDIPIISQVGEVSCITIAGDNWIGANTCIMSNVGEGTVIGSGSVVVSDLDGMMITAGNPCRVIKSRP